MDRAESRLPVPGRRLIEALLKPAAFEHSAAATELIETHISWLILAGEFAYKIKKPVSLGFLDFTSLERRKFFCEEEIRLNKPSAPDIYIDVIAITDGPNPHFGGDGEPIEYAVRMQRFDNDLRLDRQLDNEKLDQDDMKELAQAIASRHDSCAIVESDLRDHQLALTREFMWENFRWLDGIIDAELLTFLRDWTRAELNKTSVLLEQRFDNGFVRECHGDLHLANLVRMPGGIRTFDCIEFNADLRNSDVICDIAFLVMDLVARNRHDLAARFLNRYLERTGDYTGIALLDLYFVYRCLVRAKVAAISYRELSDAGEQRRLLDEALRYCGMAKRQASKASPVLIVMHGLSGSGKTWLSDALMAALPAIRIRSDIERKRMFAIAETAASGSAWGKGIYSQETDAEVYNRLCAMAATVLETGHNTILDAAFLTTAERRAAMHAAKQAGCPAVLVNVHAPEKIMRDRVAARARTGKDASEATATVISRQLAELEPIGRDEGFPVIDCENSDGVDIAGIVTMIKQQRQARGA